MPARHLDTGREAVPSRRSSGVAHRLGLFGGLVVVLGAVLISGLGIVPLASGVGSAVPATAGPQVVGPGTTTTPAGNPFACSTPTIFLAQRTPSQLYGSRSAAGTITFQAIGTTHGWNYNALGFDPADKYLYAVSLLGSGAFPTGHLLRIGSTGLIQDLGAITGDSYLTANGAVTGAFDGSGNYWVTSPGNSVVDEVSIGASPRVVKQLRLSPTNAWQAFDFTSDGGFLWGMAPSGKSVVLQRLSLATGQVTSFPAPTSVASGASFGTAWTFGNGNLGFDNNTTGELYQIGVANPSSSSPTFTVVSSYSGPISGSNNDGAACIPSPVDLSLGDSVPPSVGDASLVTWTLTVTNHGIGVSSGYVVDDSLPSAVTDVASSSPGCKVSGTSVACTEGQLPVGASATYTLTAESPQAVNTCVADAAKVVGNEEDPDPSNNVASGKTCTVPTWHLAQPPQPTFARGWLHGVDCLSTTNCVAVGGTVSGTGPGVTLVERSSGSSWTTQPSANPAPGFAAAELSSVSCPLSTFCLAVGQEQVGTTLMPMAETWNGSSWSLSFPVRGPSGSSSQLDGVSCASATFCEAVGQSQTGSTSSPLFEVWNGRAWQTQAGTLPAGSTMAGVSCSATNVCMAVGRSSTAALAARFSGGQWQQQALPLPGGTVFSGLDGVSCLPATSICETTGFYDDSSGNADSLAERWSGTAWTIQSTPNPHGSTFAELVSVSCFSASACTGVGDWSDLSGDDVTLAERWNGTSWSIQSTPNPVEIQSNLTGVSCPGATSCAAVGFYAIPKQETTVTGSPVNFFATLAAGWKGTTWSTESSENPVGVGQNIVSSLSCVSPTFCVAATGTSTPAGDAASFERWNGTGWSLGQFASDLTFAPTALSCASSSDCVVVGEVSSSQGAPLELAAEGWNGPSWSMLPTPPGTSNASLNAVDCLSQKFCIAVGTGGDVQSRASRRRLERLDLVVGQPPDAGRRLLPGVALDLVHIAQLVRRRRILQQLHNSGVRTPGRDGRWLVVDGVHPVAAPRGQRRDPRGSVVRGRWVLHGGGIRRPVGRQPVAVGRTAVGWLLVVRARPTTGPSPPGRSALGVLHRRQRLHGCRWGRAAHRRIRPVLRPEPGRTLERLHLVRPAHARSGGIDGGRLRRGGLRIPHGVHCRRKQLLPG